MAFSLTSPETQHGSSGMFSWLVFPAKTERHTANKFKDAHEVIILPVCHYLKFAKLYAAAL